MDKPQIKDTVTILVDTNYAKVSVDFLIIDVLSDTNYIYLGYAQGRVARIQYKADKQWYHQDDVDILPKLAV